jgi:transcription elongation factor Elf1
MVKFAVICANCGKKFTFQVPESISVTRSAKTPDMESVVQYSVTCPLCKTALQVEAKSS